VTDRLQEFVALAFVEIDGQLDCFGLFVEVLCAYVAVVGLGLGGHWSVVRNVPERLPLEACRPVVDALLLMVVSRHLVDLDAFLLVRTVAVILVLDEDGRNSALLAHSHAGLLQRDLGPLPEVHAAVRRLFGSAHALGTLVAQVSLVLVELHDVDALFLVFAVFVFLVDLNRFLCFVTWYLDHLFHKL